jgi:hypothetical protein
VLIPPPQIQPAIRQGEPLPDLWTRLARLNPRCLSALDSLEPAPSSEQRLHRQITIRLRGQPPDTPPISIVRPRAGDAIEQGLEEAEARGWHHPATGP